MPGYAEAVRFGSADITPTAAFMAERQRTCESRIAPSPRFDPPASSSPQLAEKTFSGRS